ncbi:MAG TPA: winged helix-turn-helix transcriptional regulator [Candidatus Merdivicinus excrementipullorum]|uniref:Winged helix-turn-helix transcriptional regulator n=1 Tax=Candidatus Merdivicinus excrementipullorum TaxID=2840867 RepID=A0A9D1K0L6_9FIRM|nr:winged helix-turn-helix transcriptional regulator [Candidatus Merdivicinus excrementipullorum]HIV20295.1 winged helix-turn-helix transcriptional regulator [Candidatus Merdivicinus intestinigallinarum]
MGFGETFQALSDPARREILVFLREKPRTAGEIAAHLGVTPAAASYHLAKLKKAELITESRRKNFIDYQLNTSVFEEILLWFQQFSKEEEK